MSIGALLMVTRHGHATPSLCIEDVDSADLRDPLKATVKAQGIVHLPLFRRWPRVNSSASS
jgi:hypothetical protein